jgi:hypothetical protein
MGFYLYPASPPARHADWPTPRPALLSGITSRGRRLLPRHRLEAGAKDAGIQIVRACIKPQLTALQGHVADKTDQ